MTLNILVRTLGTHGGTERFTYGFVEWAVAQGHAICVHSVWVARHIEGVEYRPIALHSRGSSVEAYKSYLEFMGAM